MAIIYSYPEIPDVQGGDLLLISDTGAPNKPTRSVDIDDLAAYIGTVVGVVQNLQSVLTVGNTYVSPDGHGTFTLNDITNSDGSITFVNADEGWGYQISAEEGINITDGNGNNLMSVYSSGLSITDGNRTMNVSTNALTATRNVYFPDASGTLALTSDIGGPYLPLTGGTLSGNLAIIKSQPTLTLVDGTKVSYLQNINGSLYYSAWLGDNIFQSNSGQTMVIKQNGNVGIGTTNPTNRLHVENGITKLDSKSFTSLPLGLYSSNTLTGMAIFADDPIANSGQINIDSTGSSGNNEVGMNFATGGFSSSNVKLSILNTGQLKAHSYGSGSFTGTATQRLAVDTNGNVIEIPIGSGPVDGSGTANYTARWIDTDTLGIGALYDNGTNIGIGTTNPSEMLTVGDGSSHSTINIDKGVSSNGTLLFNKGGAYSAYIRHTVYEDLNIASGAGTLQFQTGTSNLTRMVIQALGNVGIGTTAPSQKLHISGNMRLTGAFRDRLNSQGAANYVLTSTGSNGTQWVDASSSSIIGGPYLPLDGGTMTGTNGVVFPDNFKLKFGDATTPDLEIFHDGSHSRISDAGTGHLVINATDFVVNNSADTKNMIIASDGGSVNLYYNASQKFRTISAGVEVTGNIDLPSNGAILFDNTNNTEQYYIRNGGGSQSSFQIGKGNPGSDIKLIISDGGNVGIGTTDPEAKLTIKGDALNTNQPVRITNSVTDTHTGLFLNNTGNTVGEKYGMQFGGYNQYSIGGIFGVLDSTSGSTSGDITFDLCNATTAGALVERMRITHEGNVGIGTTSPNYALDISKNNASILNLHRPNSSTAAASFLDFSFNTANATEAVYARIRSDVEVNTNSAQGGDLSFHTADAGVIGEVMRLTQEGNVGIGTINPGTKLHISGGIITVNDGTGITYYEGNKINSYNANGYNIIGREGLTLSTASSDKDIILSPTGNVGIGTTSPGRQLELRGEGVVRLNGISGGAPGIDFQTSDVNDMQIRYRPTTDVLAIYSYGTSSDVVNIKKSNGNVGIGTTSPSEKLEVNGYAKASTGFKAGNYTILNESGNETSLSNSAYYPMFFKTNNSTRMTISNAGNVGIGTTSPGTINGVAFSSVGLHIKFSTLGRTITEGTSWGEYIMNHSSASANQRAKFIQSKAGNFNLGSYDDNGSQRVHMTVLNSGNVGIGTVSPTHLLTLEKASSPGLKIKDTTQGVTLLAFSQDSNSHIGTYSSHPLVLDTNSAERMRITSAGNVGIGTTTPGAKLSVNGNVKIEGTSSLLFGGSASIPSWAINHNGSDLLIDDQGGNIGSVLFNNAEGVALPRLTTTQINAISLPAQGLMAYNTTLNTICFYNGSSWQKVSHANM